MRDTPGVTIHDECLARLPDARRAVLETLRRIIRAAAPRAEECISCQLPAFRLDGKVLVLFGATAKHCAFFAGSGTAVKAHRGDLKGYSTSKGTIRFDADKPLPATLVRKIVKYRIAEDAAEQRHATRKSAESSRKKAANKAAARSRRRADKASGEKGTSASRLISARLAELGDWRGYVLRHVRKGASLRDSATLFTSSLDGNVRRAIDIHEGDELDEPAFKDLVRAAVSLNSSGSKK